MGAESQVVWFQQIGREHVALAGGKGANLGELTRAGIPVPPGFVVTTDAYVSYLGDANLSAKLASLLGALDVGDREALDRAATAAREMIVRSDRLLACAASVHEAYERLGGGLVAVRSSATAEDSETASFAGQQSTFLNISGAKGVMAAVRACWASLFEPHALHYRAQCGIDHTSCSIAVPVQRMVQSARSGVAFTIDPVTHSHETIVIEAVRGLGEALVSGQVTPDMYVVDKASLAVRDSTVVEQPRELVHAGGAASGLHTNEWRDVSTVRRTRPKLSDDEIAQLAEIIRRVEQHYGSPQDIEWAEEGGEFYIVQSRPVTTLAQAHG